MVRSVKEGGAARGLLLLLRSAHTRLGGVLWGWRFRGVGAGSWGTWLLGRRWRGRGRLIHGHHPSCSCIHLLSHHPPEVLKLLPQDVHNQPHHTSSHKQLSQKFQKPHPPLNFITIIILLLLLLLLSGAGVLPFLHLLQLPLHHLQLLHQLIQDGDTTIVLLLGVWLVLGRVCVWVLLGCGS